MQRIWTPKIQKKIKTKKQKNLPQECERELGRLARRAAELRQEIEWARLETDRKHGDAGDWRRIAISRQAKAGEHRSTPLWPICLSWFYFSSSCIRLLLVTPGSLKFPQIWPFL
jgi:hypothetical protein